MRSSLLSPRSRLSKLGGPCSIGMNRRNLANLERAAPPPNLCYPLDAAVTAFRTTHSEESPFVAPEYPPLDIADPHKSQPHALARTTFTMSTSVGVNVRSPHRLAPTRPSPRCTQPRGAPTPQRRC